MSAAAPCRPLRLARIRSTSDLLYPRLAALYRDAFAAATRRHDAATTLPDERFVMNAILRGEEFVGLLHWWEFGSFRFAEHLAIVPERRSQGDGRAVLERLIASSSLVVGEVEPPGRSPLAARRIAFYERLGFSVAPGSYRQPPYDPGSPSVELLLVSAPRRLAAVEVEPIVRTIHREVYGVDRGASAADGPP